MLARGRVRCSPADRTGRAGALARARRAGASAAAPDYVPGEVVVGYAPDPNGAAQVAHATRAVGARTVADAGTAVAAAGDSRSSRCPRSQTIWQAIAKLRRQRGVLYAVPDYIAHASGGWIPNDPGNAHLPRAGSAAVELPGRGGRRCPGRLGAHVRRPPSGRARRGDRRARHGRRVPQLGAVPGVTRLRGHALRRPLRLRGGQPATARPRGPRHVRRRHDRRGDQQPDRAHRPGLRREDHADPGARRERQRRRGRRSRTGSATRSNTTPR